MPGKRNMGADFSGDSISLNKFISDTGFCSRREADKYIADRRVTINDQVAAPGNRVNAGDAIEIDGEAIGKKKAVVYLAYNKPAGVTSTTDTKDQTNIVDAVGFPQRMFPVGRLDKDSEGLILLTNDGNIVNKILRAGNTHEKEYVVTVDKPIDREFIRAMADGVRILQQVTLPCKVTQEGKSIFRIILVQGLNRQIRRMCEALGYSVKRLVRLRIMNIRLGHLPMGTWRYLTPEEIRGMQIMISGSKSETPIEKNLPAKKRSVDKNENGKPASRNQAVKVEPEKNRAATSFKNYRKAGKRGR